MITATAIEVLHPAGPMQLLTGDERLAATVVVLFVLVLGLVNIYVNRSKQQTANRLAETDPSDVRSIIPGFVAVSGIARPAGTLLDRPSTDGTCLAYERKTRTKRRTTEANRERGKSNETSIDTTTSTSRDVTTFLVEDETGSVLVSDRDTPTLHLRRTDSITERPSDGDLAERSQDLERTTTRDARTDIVERRIHLHELHPGDEVFVYGRATEPADEIEVTDVDVDSDLVLTADEDTGDFIVTHHDEEWIIDKYTSNDQLLVGVGVTVLALVGLFVLWIPL